MADVVAEIGVPPGRIDILTHLTGASARRADGVERVIPIASVYRVRQRGESG